jgi:DNA-binding NtrC family response regulator
LYYRINVFHLELPPLRERKEDIPLLVEAMIHNLNRKHDTRVTNASLEFLANLQSRNWEGNVRELRNIVERAVILTGVGPIRATQLHSARDEAPAAAGQGPAPPQPATWDPDSVAVRVGMTIGEAERLLIEATLQHTGMSKARAASILDISTKTLHAKVKQYELSAGEAEERASA